MDADARRFKKIHSEHGHFMIPDGDIHDGKNLKTWLITQQAAFRKEILGPPRIAMLRECGVTLVSPAVAAPTNQELWNTMFQALIDFHGRHQDFHVPRGLKADGRSLYGSAHKQKKKFRNTTRGIKPDLSQKRIEQLEAKGFVAALSERRNRRKRRYHVSNEPSADPSQVNQGLQ